jgi:leucine-zipper of insertion element IS481
MQVASGLTPQAAARGAGVCPRTIRKWAARDVAEGIAGLRDRSSRPKRLHRVSPATVSRVLKRLGLNRLSALDSVFTPPLTAATEPPLSSHRTNQLVSLPRGSEITVTRQ